MYLQDLPPKELVAPPQSTMLAMPVLDIPLDNQPLHHELSIYEQFSGVL